MKGKRSDKNASVEQPDGKQKLHGGKMRGLGQSRLESWSIINLLVTAEDQARLVQSFIPSLLRWQLLWKSIVWLYKVAIPISFRHLEEIVILMSVGESLQLLHCSCVSYVVQRKDVFNLTRSLYVNSTIYLHGALLSLYRQYLLSIYREFT